jgi:NAD(P)-dependent dehydrogenase (short-subunit alcohol dehydrogenase family)
MQEFSERVAVVTGAASGIGRAFADHAASLGMRVVLADVEKAALDAAAGELAAGGADVLAVATDVTDPAAVENLAKCTIDHFGGVHAVFNNAGVLVAGSIWECTLDELRWTVDVNLWGVIHGMRTFVPILLEQGVPAHVVNTASMAGLTAAPFLDIYNATKHAVVALSESLYKELVLLGSPVRASVVCPGLIRTRIMESERNRPAASHRDPEHRELSAGGAMISQFLRDGITKDGSGWPPERVAAAAFDAIREERFYVIPAQDEVKDGMYQRIEELREGRNPGTPAILTEEAG